VIDGSLLVELGYRPAWHEDADCHGKTAMFFTNATSAAKQI